MKPIKQLQAVALGVAALAALPVAAQPAPGGWEYTIAPYAVAAGMDGAVTVKGLEADVDVPFDTILENLDLALMAHFDMRNDRWMISSDLVFMDLEATEEAVRGAATAGMQETLLEVVGGYRISPAVTLLAGVRWVDLSTSLKYAGPNADRSVEAGKSWVDPLVGFHVTAPVAARWWVALHGDVGGFGIGSELAWQGYANVGFRASQLVSVLVGYRAIDLDYEDGEGDQQFRYDVLASGPQLGVAFRF